MDNKPNNPTVNSTSSTSNQDGKEANDVAQFVRQLIFIYDDIMFLIFIISGSISATTSTRQISADV